MPDDLQGENQPESILKKYGFIPPSAEGEVSPGALPTPAGTVKPDEGTGGILQKYGFKSPAPPQSTPLQGAPSQPLPPALTGRSAPAGTSAPIIPDMKDAPRTPLSPEEEQKFQSDIRATSWHQEFVKKYGEEPNFDDPAYNYRAAWKAGVRPDQRNKVDQQYHWADSTPAGEMLKSVSHPTAWMGPFMQQYHINPDDLPADDPRVTAFKKAWQEKYPPIQGGAAPAPQSQAEGQTPAPPKNFWDSVFYTTQEGGVGKFNRWGAGLVNPTLEMLHGLARGAEKTINLATGQSPDWTWQNSPRTAGSHHC